MSVRKSRITIRRSPRFSMVAFFASNHGAVASSTSPVNILDDDYAEGGFSGTLPSLFVAIQTRGAPREGLVQHTRMLRATRGEGLRREGLRAGDCARRPAALNLIGDGATGSYTAAVSFVNSAPIGPQRQQIDTCSPILQQS
jgi:hypothetical protein